MISKKLKLSNFSAPIDVEIENCCPHCGYYNDPIKINDFGNFNSNESLKIIAILFKSSCCQRLFLSVYKFNSINNKFEHIYTYPAVKPEVLDVSLHNLSPRFVKIFNQAKASADVGNIEITCIGYRSAIEFLLKDFLIKIRNLDENKVSKMKLLEVISHFEEKEISMSADVVRIFGNDKVHFEEKYLFDYERLKRHLKYLLDAIIKEIDLATPLQKLD